MQAWILRSFKMLSQEESTERFEDNNEDDDDFVTWDEYKANEFEDLEELEDGEQPDASKLEDMSMMEEDKVLFFVSSYPYFTWACGDLFGSLFLSLSFVSIFRLPTLMVIRN